MVIFFVLFCYRTFGLIPAPRYEDKIYLLCTGYQLEIYIQGKNDSSLFIFYKC